MLTAELKSDVVSWDLDHQCGYGDAVHSAAMKYLHDEPGGGASVARTRQKGD